MFDLHLSRAIACSCTFCHLCRSDMVLPLFRSHVMLSVAYLRSRRTHHPVLVDTMRPLAHVTPAITKVSACLLLLASMARTLPWSLDLSIWYRNTCRHSLDVLVRCRCTLDRINTQPSSSRSPVPSLQPQPHLPQHPTCPLQPRGVRQGPEKSWSLVFHASRLLRRGSLFLFDPYALFLFLRQSRLAGTSFSAGSLFIVAASSTQAVIETMSDIVFS